MARGVSLAALAALCLVLALEARFKWVYWPGYDTPHLVRVQPYWSDGRPASPAELVLSQRQLDADPKLRRADPPGGARPRRPGMWSGGDRAEAPLYTYNASQITPLVSMDHAWMLNDTQRLARAEGLDWGTARELASLVAASYCNTSNIAGWNCTRCMTPPPKGSDGPDPGIPQFEIEALAWDPLWDLLGFVGWSNKLRATVIAFRGTDSRSINNWVTNMRTWRTDLNLTTPGAPAGAYVHGGFLGSWNGSLLAPTVTAAVTALQERHGPHVIYATGHSLGAALATICALELRAVQGWPEVRLYSFGSPRVGNAAFAAWFAELVPVHWRFTHNRDIVPSVAPPYMGFWHVAREVWILDDAGEHTLVGVCDGTGEDMHCHNSMCHLGLCSSVADHLLYLSEMYTPRPMGC